MTRIRTIHISIALGIAVAVAACSAGTDAQSGGAPVPFKLGTFERGGQAFVGLVLKDTQVADIAPANAAFEAANASAPKLAAPADMKQLIASYETGWKDRLGAIARDLSTARTGPSYVYAVDTLKVLPPVRPSLILNAGGSRRALRRHRGPAATRRCRASPDVSGDIRAGHLGAEAG
jgi:hypothetical protein